MFTTQASTITKVNATDTVAVSNLGINQVGFGSATIVNMTGYSKIWLFMRGANSGVQSGTVTVYVYDYTGSANLVSLTFSDTSVQFRSATASISLSGLHKIQIQAKSSVATDDPVFGDISVMIEK